MRTTTASMLIFMFLIVFTVVPAKSEIIFNPGLPSPKQRILAYKNYEDIRIDRNLDGIYDEWYLRKDNMEVRISYAGKIVSFIAISKIEGNKYRLKRFQNINGKYFLTKNISRPVMTMHGTTTECDSNNLLSTKIETLTQDLLAITSDNKSCDIKTLPIFSRNLARAFVNASQEADQIANCVEKNAKILNVDAAIVSGKIKANYGKLKTNQSSDFISCEIGEANILEGQTVETGNIKFIVSKKSTDPVETLSEISNLVHHEVIHASGVKDEASIRKVLKACVKNYSDNDQYEDGETNLFTDDILDAQSNSQSTIEPANTLGESIAKSTKVKKSPSRSISSAAAKSGNGIDMKSDIANAQVIPSAEKLSKTSVDKSPTGKEQALKESVSESTPVLRMANQAMGISNTQAVADSGSSSYSSSSSSSSSYSSPSSYSSEVGGGSGSSRGSSSSSSSGKRYQSRYGRYQSKDVGSDEYVAEEIDLTKNVEAQTARNNQNRRQPASRSYQSDTQAYQANTQSSASGARDTGSASDEVSKSKKGPASARTADASASVGGSAGSGSVNLDTGSSGGGGGGGSATASNNRGKARSASASRAPASANQGSPAQRRELMDNLKDDNYVLMKRKLNDQSYQDELSANGITVMDTYGGRWGAPQGTVIYLDNGDRFIRQR